MSIQTRDLVVKFPGKQEPTLKGISLTIPDGSFSVLVAPPAAANRRCCTALPDSSPPPPAPSPTTVKTSPHRIPGAAWPSSATCCSRG
ncbi:hypothetical protein BN970_02115 [Mycolicibacterium conceptionense]|uniref:Uncharacterized protein n=1 Tax=Mycolicibacterium conceptionense TaxID=451644 RepID=A0A0U1D965_9MYCO|nr:hypothetical protein BN970_02115 [Mycolicibacterium conceptionense]